MSLFRILRHDIRQKIINKSFLAKLPDSRISKMNTILKGNKLVRDTLAHPTLNLLKTLNKMTTFSFIENKDDSNVERIEKFYCFIKKHFETLK